MRKSLTAIASIAVIAGVFSAQAVGNGGGRGDNNSGFGWGHHKKSAQVWRADLRVPGATGPTAGVAHHGGKYGATGPTGADNATAKGQFVFAQNRTKYVWGLKLKRLTPSTDYKVGIYGPAGASGSTGATTGTTAHKKRGKKGKRSATDASTLVGATIAVKTDDQGRAWAGDKGLRSVFGLDKKSAYVVKVTDADGTVVLQGDLLRKTHRAHRGCSGYSDAGSQSRKRHHRR